MSPELLTSAQLADYFQVPIGTIHQWRSRGGGPPGFRVGRGIRYRREEVEAWLRLQEIREQEKRNHEQRLQAASKYQNRQRTRRDRAIDATLSNQPHQVR